MEYYIIKRNKSKNNLIEIIAGCNKINNSFCNIGNINNFLKGNKYSKINQFIKDNITLKNDNFNVLEKGSNQYLLQDINQLCEIFKENGNDIESIINNLNNELNKKYVRNKKHFYTSFFIENNQFIYGPFIEKDNKIYSNIQLLSSKYKGFIFKIDKYIVTDKIIIEKNKEYIDLFLLNNFLNKEYLLFNGDENNIIEILSSITSISDEINNIQNKLELEEIYKENKEIFENYLENIISNRNIFLNSESNPIFNILKEQFENINKKEMYLIKNEINELLNNKQEKVNQYLDILENLKIKEEYLNKKTKELNDIEDKISNITEKIKNGYIFEKEIIDKITNDLRFNNNFFEKKENNNQLNILNLNVNNFNLKIDEKLGFAFLIYLIEQFEKQNRYISKIELLSFLVLSQQSFLTILAGLPGSGKTSFTNIFIEASHLKELSKEIPVSKGWNSQKDLIGFENPITGKYSPDMNGLYYHLKELSYSKYNKSMSYILLDEANLSPLEHYFSIFMGKFDNEEKKEINLGKEKIYVDQNVKFIGTINYDSTTEPLSPRIIDRCPVIILENLKKEDKEGYKIPEDIYQIKDIIEHNPDCVFDFNSMNLLFNNPFVKSYKKFITLDEDLKNIYEIFTSDNPNGIKDNYGIEINVSERKSRKMHNYFNKMMEYNNIINIVNYDEKVADLAIYYFILPIISGNGESYEKRLKLLQKYLEDKKYKKSGKCLNNILKHGKEYKNFSFFYW